MCGIIKGIGRQLYAAFYSLACYYIIGLPLALALAFKYDKGIYGLWLGFTVACVILDVGLLLIIELSNWD